MRSPINRRIIQPKISTMPRQKNQATAYLEIYQLAVEQKRLQQELKAIEERKINIYQRLKAIAAQIDFLEKSAHKIKDDSGESNMASATELAPPTETISEPVQQQFQNQSEPKDVLPTYNLKTMTLEY